MDLKYSVLITLKSFLPLFPTKSLLNVILKNDVSISSPGRNTSEPFKGSPKVDTLTNFLNNLFFVFTSINFKLLKLESPSTSSERIVIKTFLISGVISFNIALANLVNVI